MNISSEDTQKKLDKALRRNLEIQKPKIEEKPTGETQLAE